MVPSAGAGPASPTRTGSALTSFQIISQVRPSAAVSLCWMDLPSTRMPAIVAIEAVEGMAYSPALKRLETPIRWAAAAGGGPGGAGPGGAGGGAGAGRRE